MRPYRSAASAFTLALLLASAGEAGAQGVDGTADSTPDAEAAPSGVPASPPIGPIRPILLVGVGGHAGDGVALAADVGLRVAPVAVRYAYRVVFAGDGYVEYASGRLGWIFAENAWVAGFAGIGAGRLTYNYPEPSAGTASVTAFAAEVGATFHPRWLLGPALALQVEAIAPLARSPDPRNATLAAPTVLVTFSVNAIGLLLASLHAF